MKNKFITVLNTTINNSFKLKVTSKKKKIGIVVLLIYLMDADIIWEKFMKWKVQ